MGGIGIDMPGGYITGGIPGIPGGMIGCIAGGCMIIGGP